LGLAITKELLRTLKGKINVESKINQGSKFIVELMDCLISFDKKKCSEDEVNNRKSKSISEKKNSYVCDSQLDLKENEFFSFQNGLSVLVIDDDHSMCSIVSAIIEEAGFTPLVSNSLEDAFELLSCNLPFLTILDLSFPSGSGIDYIEGIKKTCPSTFLLILTGDDKAFSAAQAFKNGAQEYMIKPFKKEDLQKIVFDSYKLFKQKFSESQSFVDIKESEFNHYFDSSLIIGKSIEAENLKQIIEKVSCSDETVLITGESGSGKEVAARVIHMNSYRSGGPFMAINCGALSEKILESELFGHVKGSFTGAAFDKKGLFESAKGGTLFLDEIGEAPEKVQIKLLRVLQEKQVLPVGAVRAVDIDVRVLAATNRNIEDMVKEKKFRQDLFYRLDVLRIKIPPLRVRKDDICELVKNIIKRYSEKYGVIENVVKKSLLNAENKILTVNDLPLDFRKINMVKELSKNISGDYKTEKNHMIDIFDKIFLKNQLLKTNGNVKKAAELSNMHTKNFYMKIKKAGIDPLVYKKDE
jgi:two-component system response regulator PilR (NtrC family)